MRFERDKIITGTLVPYRHIPIEDIIISNTPILDDKYTDGIFCYCGAIIKFKNRKPFETVIVICPNCDRRIIYG